MKTLLAVIAFAAVHSIALADPPKGGPLNEPVDPEQVRIAWRNLGNEQVMYPLQMKDLTVLLGSERQLFLDNYVIADADKVAREVHRPKRHPNNPVLAPPKSQPVLLYVKKPTA